MKIPVFLKKTIASLQVFLVALVALISQNLLTAAPVQAANGLNVTVVGQGQTGQFILSSQSGKFNNTGNPIMVPASGEVGVVISWAPTGNFNPTSCQGYTYSVLSGGKTVPGDVTGSGFFSPTINLPTTGVNLSLPGTIIPSDTSQRVVGIKCTDATGVYWDWEFGISFAAAPGVTGNCVPATAEQISNTSVSYYGPFPATSSYYYGGLRYDTRPYLTTDGEASRAVCSESYSSWDFLFPAATCAVECTFYNPTRTNKQSDGSYRICENGGGAYTRIDQSPYGFGFTTSITGASSPNLSATSGQPVNINLNRVNTGDSGYGATTTEVGSWNGGTSTNTIYSGLISQSWIFNTNSQGEYVDYNAMDEFTANAPNSGISIRSGSNCRAASNRTISDTGSSSGETFAYSGQQYARSGQDTTGSDRLWTDNQKPIKY